FDEVVDEVEEIDIGPMQILEHENERTVLRERLEEASPCSERLAALVAARLGAQTDADQGTEMSRNPLRLDRVGDRQPHGPLQLRARLVRSIAPEDSRLSLHHLGERPEGDAVAVGRRAALPPADDLRGILVDQAEELGHQPALADARDAGDGHQLRRALSPDSIQQIGDQAELLRAAYQRRSIGLAQVAD